MPVASQRVVGVAEATRPVVVVEVDARVVAHDEQIEIPVQVEIHEAGRVGAPEALGAESGLVRGGRPVPVAIVQEQVGGVAVVRVVEGRGHLSLHVGRLVLPEPDVEVAVRVDVAGAEDRRSA